MVSSKNLIYSIAAARRIFGKALKVVRVERWLNCCLVVFENCRARFVSCKVFATHFAEWRKLAAAQLSVSPDPLRGTFLVQNPSKGTGYLVHCFGRLGVGCECEDAENQLKFLGRRGCCKHGYAVLNHLGYSSLSAYMAAHE